MLRCVGSLHPVLLTVQDAAPSSGSLAPTVLSSVLPTGANLGFNTLSCFIIVGRLNDFYRQEVGVMQGTEGGGTGSENIQ